MRTISTKIPEDEYMELLKWCNENGYSSISSCLRGIIESILGRPQRPKMVDIEVDLKELCELNKHVREKLRKLDELERRIKEIEARLRNLEERLLRVEGLNKWLRKQKR